MTNFSEFITKSGEVILYKGDPNLALLEDLSLGYGDIWHSSLNQGYKNCFNEIVFQTATFWYINDIEGLPSSVNWRINPNHFAIRKEVWDYYNGFIDLYESDVMMALDFGYNSLCYRGVIPLFIDELFFHQQNKVIIPLVDKYSFYFRNFKPQHAIYMFYRSGFWKLSHIYAFFKARKNTERKRVEKLFPPKKLNTISGNPKVSYIIPTMLRQDFTLNLLEDLKNQTYPPNQVIVVDATPVEKRNEALYCAEKYPFEVIFLWQKTKGSCRARNEAIILSSGDYIVFGDDDIRIPSNFIESHVRLLQTYDAVACNGLDIRADDQFQDLKDLEHKLQKIDNSRWFVGVTNSFSNANSCVRKDIVDKLVGNDINYDGGYGEDSDFGIAICKTGAAVLHNPFSANLHLKPPSGGYRFWGAQSRVTGKKRKKQPWEFDYPVKQLVPVPSPTITYQILKYYTKAQLKEYRHKFMLLYLFKKPLYLALFRFFFLPYKNIQFNKSIFYAKKLIKLGKRTQ
jgi:glycosyltransferase involved in cell wall biosynthesis